MVKEMSKGGKLVWIAPSGGRDRPDPESGAWLPHRYDPGLPKPPFLYLDNCNEQVNF